MLDAVGVLAPSVISATARWAAFWRWAAVHPSLKCLALACEDSRAHRSSALVYCALLDAVLELQQRRPALRVHRGKAVDPYFFEDMLALGDIP